MSNIVDTIKILKRLRMVKAEYPTHLFEPRRAEFFNQVAAIRAEMKASEAASSQGMPVSVVEQVLKYLLIGAVVLASVLGIRTYWDEIYSFFSPNISEVQIVEISTESSQEEPSSSSVLFSTSTPILTPTFTGTPSSFPVTPDLQDVVEFTNTPAPTEKTNPGLHLGQTKTPKPKD